MDGSSEAQPLLSDEALTLPFSWSAVHQAVAYYTFGLGRSDIWTLSADGVSTPVVASAFDNRAPMFSPDSRSLAYVSDESQTNQVYVRPYPGPGAAISISSDGGIAPTWSRDGRELYFRSGDQMMVVAVDNGSSFGIPRVLFSPAYAASPIGRGNPNYDVAADGRFLMVRYLLDDDTVSPLHIVVNFTEELRARASR